jgi:hypothetical protein
MTPHGVGLAVYRAPMRSRRDDVPLDATLARAISSKVCGFGGVLAPVPRDLDDAVELAAQHDQRLAGRIARFADVATDSFVWTRDGDALFWLGRLRGPWHYDADPAAAAVDLVHVRRCAWSDIPVLPSEAPAAVLATFGRGGRNFQQIHDAAVLGQTEALWDRTRRRPRRRRA